MSARKSNRADGFHAPTVLMGELGSLMKRNDFMRRLYLQPRQETPVWFRWSRSANGSWPHWGAHQCTLALRNSSAGFTVCVVSGTRAVPENSACPARDIQLNAAG